MRPSVRLVAYRVLQGHRSAWTQAQRPLLCGQQVMEHLGSRARGLRHRGRCFGAACRGALGLESTGAQAQRPLLRGSILWSTWALGLRHMGRCFGAACRGALGHGSTGAQAHGPLLRGSICGALGLEGTGAQAQRPLLRGSILWSTWARGHRGSGTWAAASGQHIVEHLGSRAQGLRHMGRCFGAACRGALGLGSTVAQANESLRMLCSSVLCGVVCMQRDMLCPALHVRCCVPVRPSRPYREMSRSCRAALRRRL